MSYFSLGGSKDEASDFMMPVGGKNSALGNSNLSTLFGLNNQLNNNPNSNQSLTYTAPKQPGKSGMMGSQYYCCLVASNSKPQPASGTSQGVALAVAVTAYRYVNGQNVKHGKLGAAILRNVPERDFKILMYVTKQQPVSTAQINSAFHFTIQPNNYASFKDDQNQTWTILFASGTQLFDFAKQICLAKFFSDPQPKDSSVQDLIYGDQQTASVVSGDSLEMRYTGWLVDNTCSLGAVFDSNHNSEKTFRFKCGRGKVIKGWDTGVLGMRKGGKRFLVIPSQLAYGQKVVGNKIPANSTLAFEIDLLKMKQSKDNVAIDSAESAESLPQVVNEPPPPDPVLSTSEVSHLASNNMHEGETVKGRTASLTEQMNVFASDSSKNNILTRMARMGHSMIPVVSAGGAIVDNHPQLPTVNAQPQQVPSPNPSQPLSRSSTPGHVQPQQLETQPLQSQIPQSSSLSHILPQSHPIQHMDNLSQLNPYQSSTAPSYHSPIHQKNLLGIAPSSSRSAFNMQTISDPSSMYSNYSGFSMLPQYSSNPVFSPDVLSTVMSETRQQTSDMKLLQEKVDKVYGLMEEVKKITEDSQFDNHAPSEAMDAAMIMQNIQRIMKENERLKAVAAEKNKQIDQQNDKIRDLLQDNQRYVEKSNLMLEQRNDSFKESFTQSQARSLQLEEEKVQLTQRLSAATSKVSELTLEVTDIKQRESDFKHKVKEIFMKEKERAEEAEERVLELEGQLKDNERAILLAKSSSNESVLVAEHLKASIAELEEKSKKNEEKYKKDIEKLNEEKGDLENRLLKAESTFKTQVDELKNNSEKSNDLSQKQSNEVNSLRQQVETLEAESKELVERKDAAEKKVHLLEKKMSEVKLAHDMQQVLLEEAQAKVEEIAAYKPAYERLRAQATMMKEKYEERFKELKNALSTDKNRQSDINLNQEVKKIINTIYQRTRGEIDPEAKYTGAFILKLLLVIIKSTTLSLLGKENDASDKEDEEGQKKSVKFSDNDQKTSESEKTPFNQQEEPNSVKKDPEEYSKTSKEASAVLPEDTNSKTIPGTPDTSNQTSYDVTDSNNQTSQDATDTTNQTSYDTTDVSNQTSIDVTDQGDRESDQSSQKNDHEETSTDKKSDIQSQSEEEEGQGETDTADPSVTDESEEIKRTRMSSDGELPNVLEPIDESINEDQPSVSGQGADSADDYSKKSPNKSPNRLSPAPTNKPAVHKKASSISSGSSTSDDRRPPPLFDDDSDDEDVDWLK